MLADFSRRRAPRTRFAVARQNHRVVVLRRELTESLQGGGTPTAPALRFQRGFDGEHLFGVAITFADEPVVDDHPLLARWRRQEFGVLDTPVPVLAHCPTPFASKFFSRHACAGWQGILRGIFSPTIFASTLRAASLFVSEKINSNLRVCGCD